MFVPLSFFNPLLLLLLEASVESKQTMASFGLVQGVENRDAEVTQVYGFDGQTVYESGNTPLYEVGNFLGGGAAGTVYECENSRTREHFALKILNPLGFKLVAPALLRKCVVAVKGVVLSSSETEKSAEISSENIWWLVDGSTKQYIAAYYSERQNCLKDLTLNQCIQIWGANPPVSEVDSQADMGNSNGDMIEIIDTQNGGNKVLVPRIPPKYADFVRRRDRIFREIKNMRKISTHVNVIRLEGVLELTQESKCTIFLVMELANGGELFDRIKIDCGTRETTARFFFQQLLEGVRHCHEQGVCHRDLKPENLLLQDGIMDEDTVLKIADFGFSARFAMEGSSIEKDTPQYKQKQEMMRQQHEQQVVHTGITPVAPPSFLEDYSPLRMLKSVVGSPFYVAPEVLQARGYDGPRADIWSLGVILYAMLAGNLPFGQELGTCKRFRHFCKWVREQQQRNETFWEEPDLEYPPWLFPAKFSALAKGLIVSMLHPDPNCRINVATAMQHPLCVKTPAEAAAAASKENIQSAGADTENDTEMATEDDKANIIELTAVASAMSIGNQGVEDEEYDDDDEDDDDDGGVFRMEEDGETDSRINAQDDVSSPPAPINTGGAATWNNHTPTEAKRIPQAYMSPSAAAAGATAKFASSYDNSSFGSPPPAPALVHSRSIDDLVIADEVSSPRDAFGNRFGDASTRSNTSESNSSSHSGRSQVQDPPAFSDLVKRSTRFLTTVPADQVLLKVQGLLEECRFQKTQTPLGFIGKVEMRWDIFRLEVWGLDTTGPPLCSLQLYQMPQDTSIAASPEPSRGYMAGSFDANNAGGAPRPLFLVEFIRDQLEIFAFKRFYQWVRQRVSELVKRDFAGVNYFEAQSPMVDSSLLAKYQQTNV